MTIPVLGLLSHPVNSVEVFISAHSRHRLIEKIHQLRNPIKSIPSSTCTFMEKFNLYYNHYFPMDSLLQKNPTRLINIICKYKYIYFNINYIYTTVAY